MPNHRSSHSTPTPRGGGLACLLGVLAASVTGAVIGVEVPWVLLAAAMSAVARGLCRRPVQAFPARATRRSGRRGRRHGLVAGRWVACCSLARCWPRSWSTSSTSWTASTASPASASPSGERRPGLVGLVSGTAEPVWVLGRRGSSARPLAFFRGTPHRPGSSSATWAAISSAGSSPLACWQGLAADASPIVLAAPLALYLVDTGTVLVRRAYRRESLVTAHREHAYQRLTSELGRPHILVAMVVAGLAAALTAAWAVAPWWAALIATVAVCGGYAASPRLSTAVRRQPSLLGGGR